MSTQDRTDRHYVTRSEFDALERRVVDALTSVVAGLLALASSVVACVVLWDRSSMAGWHVVLVPGSLLFPGLLVLLAMSPVVEPLMRRLVLTGQH